MPYSEKLAARLRTALHQIPKVEEKKMFGHLAFMVNNKMCISAGNDGIMCRINPAQHEEAVQQEGCTTVIMGGRKYTGYVRVSEAALKTKKALDYWISLALEYNKIAKASKK